MASKSIVRGFGGCCDLLCPVGFLVVWNAPFSVGVGVGSRVFWRLAGVVFWPRLFWLCVIGTRILLRFARKKKEVGVPEQKKASRLATVARQFETL